MTGTGIKQGRFALFLNEPGNLRLLFYAAWLLVSILQARFTGLWNDEAYYWEYSRDLAWGYFDHPPMIALLIKEGYFLFHNELGVRFLIILFSTGTIYLIEKILQPPNRLLYYAIVASIGIFQIGGIIAVPDIPLLFFTASFFLFYKRYLDREKFSDSLLLALNIALLLYSKYHGILIIGFTVLSNLSLFRKKSFWLIVLVSIVFMLPHIYWQYANDWPSIYYHLVDRSPEDYKFSQTLNFVFSQFALPGSITAILLWYYGFRYKPQDLLEKALKFNLAGIYLFFFIMSFKTRIEANWTVPVLIPLIILAYRQSYLNEKARKLYYIFFWISMAIILFARVFLLVDFFPSSNNFMPEFHKWDKWAGQIHKISGDLPVVFKNTYQKPSKYEFYTHHTAFSINTPKYRKTFFDYRNTLEELQGKKVMFFSAEPFSGCDSVQIFNDFPYYREVDNFRLYPEVEIVPDKHNYVMKSGHPYALSIMLKTKDDSHPDFEANPDLPSYIYFIFLKEGEIVWEGKTDLLLTNQTRFNKPLNITIIPPIEKGTYQLGISIKTGYLPPTINCRKVKTEVW